MEKDDKKKKQGMDSKEAKEAAVAASLEEATLALTIELEDIANDIGPGIEYLSGKKPRKGKPGHKKHEHDKKEKRKVNKHRKNDAKAVKPNRNSDMKVKLDNLAASKAEKDRGPHPSTLDAEMKEINNSAKAGKARV